MQSTISFTPGAKLTTLTANDYCGMGIQPFLQETIDRFVDTKDLESAIALAADNHRKVVDTLFDLDLDDPLGSFSLKEEFLFPKDNPLVSMSFTNTKMSPFLPPEKPELMLKRSLPEVRRLLHLCGQGKYTYREICDRLNESEIALLDKFLKTWVVREDVAPAADLNLKPGVHRLQHAALLYRTETTGILVDPQLHSNYGLSDIKEDITRAQLEGMVDAILISHNHYDHWNCSTLMMFDADIPIIVPKVPRGSITCEDMASRLRSFGFNHVIDVDWYAEPIIVGDIEIHVLPFYGEQPLTPQYNETKHPDLRNWGNTYFLRTPQYTSWFLIDSGDDPLGETREVAAYLRDKFGGVDWVLSNFQSLSYNSIGTDLSEWGADIIGTLLSNPQMFAVFHQPEGYYQATLGAKGVAEVCSIVNAKACLPYAHSWAKLGEYTPCDRAHIEAVNEELKAIGSSTKVIPWRIGDGFSDGSTYPAFR